MRILISGGSGYIGSVLVPLLLSQGHQVRVLDNFLYGNQTSLASLCHNPDFDIHRVDCRDHAEVSKHLHWPDVVIPLAALVGVPLCDLNPIDAELINLRAPLNIFKSLSNDQLIIMPTTESSYGKNESVCTEETPLNPLSTYALHKVEVESALLERDNAVSLRLATVFGMSPRMRLDLLINDFVWRALKDRAFVVFEGKYNRTCVHVSDVSRAFNHALDKDLRGVYNIGAVTISKLSLCEAIKVFIPEFTYVEADYLSDSDQRDYIVSDDKIRATGYVPRVTLPIGITELLKGYRMLTNNVHGNV